jgi:hypothetical protein
MANGILRHREDVELSTTYLERWQAAIAQAAASLRGIAGLQWHRARTFSHWSVVGQRVDPTLLWDVVRLGGNQQQAAFGTVLLAARLIDMFGQRAERSLDLVLYGLLPDGRPFAGMTLREAAERFAAEIGDDWRAPRRLTELLAGPGDQEPWRDWFGRLVHEATPAVAGAIAYGVPGVDVNAIIRWLEWVATAADLTPAAAAGAGVRWGDHDGARVLTDMARVGAASFFPALQQVAASPPPQDVTTAWQQAQRRPARALRAYLHYRGAPVAEDIPAPAVDAPRPASRGLALRAVLDNTLTALLDLQEADRILSGSAPRSGREPIRSGRLRESIGAIRQAWLMVDAELDRLGTVRSDEGVRRSVDEAADLFGLYQANPPRTHLDDEAGRRAHEAAIRAVVEFEELRRQLSAAAGPDVPPGPGRWFDRPPQGPQPITPGSPRGPDGGPRQPAAAASEPSRQVLDRIAATLDGLDGAFVAGESVLWVGLCRAAQPLVGALAADVAARLGPLRAEVARARAEAGEQRGAAAFWQSYWLAEAGARFVTAISRLAEATGGTRTESLPADLARRVRDDVVAAAESLRSDLALLATAADGPPRWSPLDPRAWLRELPRDGIDRLAALVCTLEADPDLTGLPQPASEIGGRSLRYLVADLAEQLSRLPGEVRDVIDRGRWLAEGELPDVGEMPATFLQLAAQVAAEMARLRNSIAALPATEKQQAALGAWHDAWRAWATPAAHLDGPLLLERLEYGAGSRDEVLFGQAVLATVVRDAEGLHCILADGFPSGLPVGEVLREFTHRRRAARGGGADLPARACDRGADRAGGGRPRCCPRRG